MFYSGKGFYFSRLKLIGAAIIMTVLIVFSALTIYGAVYGDSAYSYMNEEEKVCYKTIIVSEGDSLWSLAQSYSEDREDVRKKVYEICELNGIENSVIFPGQQLMIPEC